MSGILVVDDDVTVGEILLTYLKHSDLEGQHVESASELLARLDAMQPDLLVLDVMLPDGDGMALCAQVRSSHPDLPVILLTARSEEIDRIAGLTAGADDYVVKPYSPREVVARIKAVLRRSSGQLLAPEVYEVGVIRVDLARYITTCEGEEVDLTPAELRLLAALAKDAPMVKGRPELLAASGDAERFADERVVDAHVKNIRKKLGNCGEKLETIRGVGYRLRA